MGDGFYLLENVIEPGERMTDAAPVFQYLLADAGVDQLDDFGKNVLASSSARNCLGDFGEDLALAQSKAQRVLDRGRCIECGRHLRTREAGRFCF